MLATLLLSVLATTLVAAAPLPLGPTSFVSAGWYHGYAGISLMPSGINWQKYTFVSYAFALTTQDPSVLGFDEFDTTNIPEFVKLAKEHGTKASISIGGWSGSRYFSGAVTPENRSKFVKAILDLVTKYELDAIDMDWEEPGRDNGSNQFSPDDTANFLAFLQELRADPAGNGLYISAAVPVTTYVGPDGQPLADMSEFAKVFDHIAIMNYDTNGQYSVETGAGPSAALDDSCAKVPNGSATKAIKTWIDAGFPAKKIILGVPSYGHTFNVKPSDAVDGSGDLASFPPFTQWPADVGDAISLGGMVEQGYLNSDGTHASNFKYKFDECSKTPFLYDESKETLISYDDAQSFAAKGDFVVKNGLLGFSMWDLACDYKNILLDSITSAVGTSR